MKLVYYGQCMAAARIQGLARGRVARLHSAALAHEKMVELGRYMAATKIQTVVRCAAARTTLFEALFAAVALQVTKYRTSYT